MSKESVYKYWQKWIHKEGSKYNGKDMSLEELWDFAEHYHQQELKKACTDFFYWWYNQEGNNTKEGFEKWYNEVYKLKQK